MDDSCAVCAESLEWVAYGACGHKDVCSTCVARLRFICNDRRCCICKTESGIVFVTKALGDYTNSIGDFSLLPSEAKEGRVGRYWYHEDTLAFFDDVDHYKMIKAMCKLSCSVCQKMEDIPDDASRRMAKFRNIEQLKGHLFHKHKLLMCSLCLEGRKVFICEQKLYTRSQLTQHINTGDSEVDGTESERGGFAGHPMCEFCRTPFYGDNELYTHMSTEHYTCHLCQRQHPGQYEYYKNYDDLEIHFRRDHFLCEDEDCLGKKFIVFQSEAELKRHNTLDHGGRMSRSKRSAALQIPTSFRYKRSIEQESRRGRGRTFSRDPADGELSLAIQASLDTMGASPSRAITDYGEVAGVESLIPSLESMATSGSEPPSRYLQALSLISRSGTLGESSFPPLPVASRNNQSNVNPDVIPKKSMAAHLHRQRNKKANTSSSNPVWAIASRAPVQQVVDPHAWPSINAVSGSTSCSGQGRTVAEIGSAASGNSTSAQTRAVESSNSNSAQTGSPLTSNSTSAQTRSPLTANTSFAGSLISSRTGSKGSISHSSSAPNLSERESLESSSSSFPTVQAALAHKTPMADKALKKVEDVHTANKSLLEKMRVALGFDEDKLSAFKGISGEYRQGSMDAEAYLTFVEQFGLSHLVPEMARLLPNAQKQKELTEAYNVNMAYSTPKDNGWGGEIHGGTGSKKGKGKLIDSGSTTIKDKLADNVMNTPKNNGLGGEIKGGTGSKKGKGKLIDSGSNTDNVISTVKELQSSFRALEEEVEVLSKDGYRGARGKSKVFVDDSLLGLRRPGESEKLKNPTESLPTRVRASNECSSNGGDGKSKQRKKTSKFHRVRLGDGSVEALLDIKNADPDPDPGLNRNETSSNGPSRSVWRNGGGQKLLARTSRGPKSRV